MEIPNNSMRSVDGHTTVVTGATLAEAFHKVRQQFGPEAVISGSRSRALEREQGIGQPKIIEVLVETPGNNLGQSRSAPSSTSDLTQKFRREVERIERMVDEVWQDSPQGVEDTGPTTLPPLAEHLVENGASLAVVERILTRFAVETGFSPNDRPAALSWLKNYLACSGETLEISNGHHVFLSEYEGESLGYILNLTASLTEIGRRVLVVSVLPDPDRDEPRLKKLAAANEHDAAVIRDEDHLSGMSDHLDRYDLVLLHLPGLTDHRMAEGGAIHRWLACQPDIQRHLLLPMDRDFLDLDPLRSAARSWTCDAVALTRTSRTRRPAKILDLMDRIPLPISFLTMNEAGKETLICATVDHLLDKILTAKIDGMESAFEVTSHNTRKVG